MPSKTKTTAAADPAPKPHFPAELLEQLIPGPVPVTPAELEGSFQQFKKSVLERAPVTDLSPSLFKVSAMACIVIPCSANPAILVFSAACTGSAHHSLVVFVVAVSLTSMQASAVPSGIRITGRLRLWAAREGRGHERTVPAGGL